MHAESESEKPSPVIAATVETLLWWHVAPHENGTSFLARKIKHTDFAKTV